MALDYLNTLGTAKEKLKTVANTEMGTIAQAFAKKIEAEIKANAPIGSGSLANSVQPVVKQEGTKLIVQFLANDYWDFVNSGVDGYQQSAGAITNSLGTTYSFAEVSKGASNSAVSFKESIEKWIQSKGIMAEDGDYDSLQFMIMRSIKQKGIPPTRFIDKVFTTEVVEQFENDIFKAFSKLL